MAGGIMAQAAVLQQDEATLAQASPGDSKRVNVIFSNEQYNTLLNLARMQNISVSEALRQAISVSDLIVNANADANTKILLKTGDSVQELKIVR
jgi:hypothetical protein